MKVHSVFCDHSNNNLENWRSENGRCETWYLEVLDTSGVTTLRKCRSTLHWNGPAAIELGCRSADALHCPWYGVQKGLVCLIGGTAYTLARALSDRGFTVFRDIPGISCFNTLIL
jgi:hypothetical protein